MIRAGIAGASGYTGSELIRILLNHPEIEISMVTSERNAGNPVTDIHPQFQGFKEITLTSIKELDPSKLDILFLALPHRVSMGFVAEHYPFDCPVIDLSGDFRLPDVEAYECWYGEKHKKPELLDSVVFGLPELFRDKIKSSRLTSNPGCYPTSAIIPLAPLAAGKLIDTDTIVVDAKSGTTGAGASAKENTHYPNVADNFSVYGVKTHRHTPEIELTIKRMCGTRPTVQFTPHLLPVNRGILTVSYSIAKPGVSEKKLKQVYRDYYGDEPFVRLVDKPPQLKQIRGSNFCDLFVTFDERTNRVITISAIDNLVKGAAGQAVQNMNLMLGIDETQGLMLPPLCP